MIDTSFSYDPSEHWDGAQPMRQQIKAQLTVLSDGEYRYMTQTVNVSPPTFMFGTGYLLWNDGKVVHSYCTSGVTIPQWLINAYQDHVRRQTRDAILE